MSSVSILDAPFPRVVFGVGSVSTVADEVGRLGARAVLLIVDSSALPTGDEIASALGDAMASRIDGVVMHVPVDVASSAVAQARDAGVDLLLSVGGGSATGLAKAVALETGLPILAVPTTYAGSEMTPIWGLTERSSKRTGRDPRVRPRVVVYDPALTVSLPPGLSAASGLNSMAHLMSGLFTAEVPPGAAPVVAALAEEGVRVLASALPRVVASPGDLSARSDALYGAWLAGWTLGAGATGVHHRVCHVLGGAYNLPHAETHAALLPYSTAFLAPYAPAGAERAARALGGPSGAEGSGGLGGPGTPGGLGGPGGALYDLARSIGAPTSLADIGFEPGQIDVVAQQVAAAPPPSPRPIDVDAIRTLLIAACDGSRPS